MRDTTMHSPHPDLKRLLNILRFASDIETRSHQCEPEPEPTAQPEAATEPGAAILEAILRTRTLMGRIESGGVRLPVQIYDILVQAVIAYEQNRWTEQIDRRLCITLNLLESVARHRRGAAAACAVCTEPTLVNYDTPSPADITHDGQKVHDGIW
jgi:hypothetical protein